ncbi:MAG: glycosyltransferase family 4 protein [Hyphomicrobiales bacterium]|nr:glycosyltransferase family 4 protein [Hyphomicrobiales bacterium]
MHTKKQLVLLQVLPRLDSGGVERGTLEVAKAAVEEGFTSLVASSGGAMVTQLEAEGSRHITLPLKGRNPLTIFRNASRLTEVIRREGVDIVHARSRAPGWSALMAARCAGVPFLTTFHGYYSLRYRYGPKYWYNSVMVRGERVIAISEFIAAHLKEAYHVPEERIRLIPRGADTVLFNPERVREAEMVALRQQWGLAEPWPVIFVPGRIVRRKGQALVLEALKHMADQDWHCVMAGNAKGHEAYAAELLQKAESYGLKDRVRIVPPCSAMSAAYALAAVTINASTLPEAFGRIPVEAQAMGCPVVATALGGALETVQDGKTGWLVDAKRPEAMAEALKTALTMDASARAAMAHAARTHVEKYFSMHQMCGKTLELYYELLA